MVSVFYRCSCGHEIASPKELAACPAFDKGSPCRGTLTRFGTGSRKASERVPATIPLDLGV